MSKVKPPLNFRVDEMVTGYKPCQWDLSTWQWQKEALHGHVGSHEN